MKSYEYQGIANHWLLHPLLKSLLWLTAKKTSKLVITSLLWRESTSDWWIPFTNGPVMWNMFPCHYVIMVRGIKERAECSRCMALPLAYREICWNLWLTVTRLTHWSLCVKREWLDCKQGKYHFLSHTPLASWLKKHLRAQGHSQPQQQNTSPPVQQLNSTFYSVCAYPYFIQTWSMMTFTKITSASDIQTTWLWPQWFSELGHSIAIVWFLGYIQIVLSLYKYIKLELGFALDNSKWGSGTIWDAL